MDSTEWLCFSQAAVVWTAGLHVEMIALELEKVRDLASNKVSFWWVFQTYKLFRKRFHNIVYPNVSFRCRFECVVCTVNAFKQLYLKPGDPLGGICIYGVLTRSTIHQLTTHPWKKGLFFITTTKCAGRGWGGKWELKNFSKDIPHPWVVFIFLDPPPRCRVSTLFCRPCIDCC